MTSPTTPAEPFDALAFPNRLNIGCGWDKRDGYLNIDFQDYHGPDLVADVRDLSILPSDHYVEIVAQDVLEHLERNEVQPALDEWARLLEVGGLLVLRLPDLLGLVRVLLRENTVEHHKTMFQCLFGTQAYTGDYHHAGFTELTLRHALHESGFVVRDMARFDEWMFDCTAEYVGDPGPFDPGPLPFLDVVPAERLLQSDAASGDGTLGPAPEPSKVDRVVSRIAARVPGKLRERGRAVWHPLRRRLADKGIV